MPGEPSIPSTESPAPPPFEPERFEDASDWLALVQDPVERAYVAVRARKRLRFPWLWFIPGYLIVLLCWFLLDYLLGLSGSSNRPIWRIWWAVTRIGFVGLFGTAMFWYSRPRDCRAVWQELHALGYGVCPKCGYLCGKSQSTICPECGQEQ